MFVKNKEEIFDKLMGLKGKEEVLAGLVECVQPLELQERKKLEEIMTELKQDFGGEGWAIGEMLQRVIYLLGNTECYNSD
jgi:hypothetical protein